MTLLAACGSSDEPEAAPAANVGAPAGVEHAKAEVAKFEAGVPISDLPKITDLPDLTGKTVWFVPIGSAVPVIAQVGAAMTEALAHVGAKVQVCDGRFSPVTIAACLNQAADQRAGAVVTAYVDYAQLPTAFENLVKQKIPVLVGGDSETPDRKSDRDLAFYDTDATPVMVGRVGADAAIADSNGKADILFVNLADSSGTMTSTKAAEAEVKAQCPDCTFQTVDMQTAKVDKVPSAVSAKLVADPAIDYVLNLNDTFVPQIISGIKSAGRGDTVKVISGSADLSGLSRVKAGDMQVYDVGAAPTVTGWFFANSLLRLLAGEAPAKGDNSGAKLFSKNNVGDLVLQPEKYKTNEWYGGNDFEKAFLTAWGAR